MEENSHCRANIAINFSHILVGHRIYLHYQQDSVYCTYQQRFGCDSDSWVKASLCAYLFLIKKEMHEPLSYLFNVTQIV